MFDFKEDFSGIDSDTNGRMFFEWIDGLKFIKVNENVKRPFTRRSVHRDGFFPRKLSGNYKLLEPFLEELQVYSSYVDENGNVKKGVNEACFAYALSQSGIDKDTIQKILSFVGFQKRISRNVWSEIANAFDLRIHLRYYDTKKGRINNASSNNKGYYGNGKTEVRLCEYLDHVFIDKELPINLFAIKNWNKLCEITETQPERDVARMLMAREFDSKAGFKIKTDRANAKSLEESVTKCGRGWGCLKSACTRVPTSLRHPSETF
jgi:hypothetical protein